MQALTNWSGGRGMRGLWLMFGVCAIFAAAMPCHGQVWLEEAKLLAHEDGEPFHEFGRSVAVDGDVALIGSPGDYNQGLGYEAWVYRYVDFSWVPEANLIPVYADADDGIGYSVALDGDVAVISAPNYQSWIGAVWVYRYNQGTSQWEEEATLQASNPDFRMFGASVAIEDDVIVVGAYTDDDAGTNAGAAYVFRYEGGNWSQEQKLLADDGEESSYFGSSVSISLGIILVGASIDDPGGVVNAGSAYVFEHNGTSWQQEQKLVASDGAQSDEFGTSVSIDGDTLVVGAQGDGGTNDTGSAYVFQHNGSSWVEETRLEASDAHEGDHFGWSVAIEDVSPDVDVIVIGAPAGYPEASPGHAYVFRNTGSGWGEEAILAASDGLEQYEFGGSVAIFQDTALIGAPADAYGGMNAGAAYVFENAKGWTETAKLTAINAEDEFELFGSAVAIDEDVAVVGAPSHESFGITGSVDVYRFNGTDWLWEARLLAPDPVETHAEYGCAVAVSGDVAIVGARAAEGLYDDSGAAYVFRYDGASWNFEEKLIGWDMTPNAEFGHSVAIAGNVAVIGAPEGEYDKGVQGSGIAFVYRYDQNGQTWNQDYMFQPFKYRQEAEYGYSVAISSDAELVIIGAPGVDDGEGAAQIWKWDGQYWDDDWYVYWEFPVQGMRFGHSVAIEGDWAVCGSPFFDVKYEQPGIATVFNYDDDDDEWDLIADLEGQQSATFFGASVAMDSERMIIGAPGSLYDTKSGPGSAEVFFFDSADDEWEFQEEITALDAADYDGFGWSVALWNNTALIGAPGDGDNMNLSGSAYVFIATAENRYEGPEGGTWFNGDHWSLGYVPTEDNDVIIPDGGHVVIDGFPAESLTTTIQDGGSVTLDFNNLIAYEGLFIDAGGALYGDDTVNADVVNSGLVSPGIPLGASFATLWIDGEYSQTETGELLIELGESGQHDQLDVGFDAVTLGGTLSVEMVDPYDGWHEDVFDVIEYSSVEGGFATMNLPDPADECLFMTLKVMTDVLQIVFQPPPGSTLEVEELDKVLASDGATWDLLGYAVSVWEDVADIGSPYDSDGASWSGAAYVYRNNGTSWEEEAKLMAPDSADDDRFGSAVSICGDVILIGAPGVDDGNTSNVGAAYVFRYDGNNWTEEGKLKSSKRGDGGRFGCSVSIEGDLALIGEYWYEEVPDRVGAAYVFRYDGAIWNQESQLLASDGADGDYFGWSVSLSGDAALIGAWRHDSNAVDSGSAYVFRYDGMNWIEESILVAWDGAAGDWFGSSVSISGDVVVVGASADDDNGEDSGSAYAFRYNGLAWIGESKLAASDGAADHAFGLSVSVSGNSAVIGAPYDDDYGSQTGAAYLFRFNGSSWFEDSKLPASEAAEGDTIGWSVAIRDDMAVVGAYGDADNGYMSGSAYVYAVEIVDDCNGNGFADDCDIQFGYSQDVNGNGIPDECECPADVNFDQIVDIDDLFAVLAAWGQCDDCPEDINDDGVVDIDDVFAVLAAWGPCW